MAAYRFAVGALAPLQIQLGPVVAAPLNAGVARIREAAAYGENAIGTASNPILVRPSVIGTGTQIFVAPLDPGGASSTFQLITSFSSAPTHFTPASGPVTLPITRRIVFPRGSEFIVYGPSAAALLYANASGGHTWSGELAWEEK